MAYTLMRRPWRVRKPYYFLMLPELLVVVALLVLFGLSQPNTYRTKLWRAGFEHGFNSNPNMILYAYANHEPLPKVPFVWSQTLTNFNVAISVLSLFVLIGKMICLIMHVFFPIFGTVLSVAMVALYTTSVYGQAGPDYADVRYPSPSAWYITKSCNYAQIENAVGGCLMAKGSFAVTVLMLAINLANLGFGIFSLWPNKALDLEDDSDDDDAYAAVAASRAASRQREMRSQPMMSPRSPNSFMMSGGASGMASPFTPRTQAFHALDRKLPLRGH